MHPASATTLIIMKNTLTLHFEQLVFLQILIVIILIKKIIIKPTNKNNKMITFNIYNYIFVDFKDCEFAMSL